MNTPKSPQPKQTAQLPPAGAKPQDPKTEPESPPPPRIKRDKPRMTGLAKVQWTRPLKAAGPLEHAPVNETDLRNALDELHNAQAMITRYPVHFKTFTMASVELKTAFGKPPTIVARWTARSNAAADFLARKDPKFSRTPPEEL